MEGKYTYLASRRFVKNWSRFDQKTKTEIVRKIEIFLKDPHTPSLKTHKLTGELRDCWSFSATYHLRIMFRFSKGKAVEFIDIGSHEIYK